MEKYGWTLVSKKTGEPVPEGTLVETFRGEYAAVNGGMPPRHDASTGRVYTDLGEHFPSVYGLEWVEDRA